MPPLVLSSDSQILESPDLCRIDAAFRDRLPDRAIDGADQIVVEVEHCSNCGIELRVRSLIPMLPVSHPRMACGERWPTTEGDS